MPAQHLPRALLLLVAALTAILPLSIEGMSPVLPSLTSDLAVPRADVAAAMSAFVIAFAAAQLFCGMLADAVGRRPVIYAGLILYIAASLIGASAHDFVVVVTARVLQGLGCAALALLARTIVRDLLDRADAARTLALVGAIYGPVPTLAPLLSGGLVMLFGWRAPLLSMGVICAIVALASLRILPETLSPERRLPLNPGGVLRSLGGLARSKALLAFVFGNAFAYSVLFMFSTGAPQVIVGRLGETAGHYSIMLAISTLGFVFGSLLSNRMIRTHSLEAALRFGTVIQVSAGIVMIAATALWPGAWEALVVPEIFYTFGWGVVQPQMQAGALSLHPRAIGQASALLGFGQLAVAGVIAAGFARLTTGSALSLAIGMAFCAGMALLCAWVFIGRMREA
ncbi:MFS transporter [Sphingobium nicotianae]|uniref:MFS transporter n=1 Tax=Sphingobium nicotianae TaxID=2782607 RepID=A0A9X1IS80_9SPHN|nr:MFS transporter [Sphingobium nicotianae]